MGSEIFPTKEYIESGEYFEDARKWYNFKYLNPLSHRSLLFFTFLIAIAILFSIAINIYSLLPLVKKVRYLISSENIFQASANITHISGVDTDPTVAIAKIMASDYVIKRESYDYDNLKPQFIFVQNSSTRLVFRKFYNFMNIDNALSPIMRYQKYIRKSAQIVSIEYIGSGEVSVVFESQAKSASGEIFENMIWNAKINFEIDNVDSNLPAGSRFKFTVTDYQLKLLKDKIKK